MPEAAQLVYDVDLERLGPELAARFLPLTRDGATERWLSELGARPHGWLTTKLSAWLSGAMSLYDVHGWLGAYALHLLSEESYRALLGEHARGRLLDVGAGAGYVTEHARPLFSELVCTETAPRLARRLRARGFQVEALDLSARPLQTDFDVVSCLNVLDRTPRPLSLLAALAAHLKPGGRLLISLPLPISAHVHVAGGTIAAQERLPAQARAFEEAARELSERLFAPRGLRVERFTRLPYLSRGDLHAPYYVLDAGVWVLARD